MEETEHFFYKKFELGLFRYDYVIVLPKTSSGNNVDLKEVIDKLNLKNNLIAAVDDAEGFTCTVKSGDFSIMFCAEPFKPEVVSHEAFHVASRALTYFGVTFFERDGNETYAHAISEIVENTYKLIKARERRLIDAAC